jgi:hypothetical protein
MGFFRKLFGTKPHKATAKDLFSGMTYLDLRSEEERQIEAAAHAGLSLGPEGDRLVAELIEIGFRDDFIGGQAGGKFDHRRYHRRAREIGSRLHELGGMKLMLAAGYRVRAVSGPLARHLEFAWAGIGEWIGG